MLDPRGPRPGQGPLRDRERRSGGAGRGRLRLDGPPGAYCRAVGFGDRPSDGGRALPPPGRGARGGVVIRVLIAEDMNLIRGALVALLSLETDIEVVAQIDRGDMILETAVRTLPDVAVLDIDLPGLDGLSAAGLLHEHLPTCHTLILTGLGQPGNLLRALKVHVRGFMLKDAPADRLADAVRRVAAGQRVLDPELVAAAVETGTSPLTERE